MKEIYISLSGNDTNSGSIENPIKTLNEAKKRIIEAKEDVAVYIRGGRYFIKESFVLDNSIENKVTFKAYEGEKVYFDGGIVLDSKKAQKLSDEKIKSRIIEKKALDNIMEIDLSAYDIDYSKYGTRGFRRAYVPSGNELFINSEPYNVARYPKIGNELIPIKTVVDSGSKPYNKEFDMRPATFVYEDKRCDLWKNAKGFYVSGLFNWCFADDTIEIASIDTEKKTLTTALPHLAGFKADSFTSWYAVNLLEEISEKGEYFVDSETKKLYFYPTENIENALIQLSNLGEPMIVLEDASYITFDGIIFENSRGTGAYIENGEGCIFENCIFRNLGMVGVQIGKGATALPEGKHTAHGVQAEGVDSPKSASRIIGSWHEMLYEYAAWNNEGGKNHGIVNCEIYNTATGGVLLGGGDRKTLTPAGNYVHNCEIHNVNRLDRTYKAGVNICGVGNRISNCDIYDMPGFAIYLHGNDHIIEYNKIHNVVNEVSDAGAIYWGRDLSEVGNEVRYNFMYNITGLKTKAMGVCAVYLDDYASFNKVYQNYFYNITQTRQAGCYGVVFWNCGGQTSVNNNIFVDCPDPFNPKFNSIKGINKLLHAKENNIKDDIHEVRVSTSDPEDIRGVDVTSEIWKEKYPYLYNLYNGTCNNEMTVWCNVNIHGGEDLFKDKKNLDLSLTGDKLKWEEMVNIDDPIMGVREDRVHFEIVDFDKIGRK